MRKGGSWATESNRLSREYTYKDENGKVIESGDELGEAYQKRSLPIVEQQLSKAGVHMGLLLNETFAKAAAAPVPAEKEKEEAKEEEKEVEPAAAE